MQKTKRALIFIITVSVVFCLFLVIPARAQTPNQNHSSSDITASSKTIDATLNSNANSSIYSLRSFQLTKGLNPRYAVSQNSKILPSHPLAASSVVELLTVAYVNNNNYTAARFRIPSSLLPAKKSTGTHDNDELGEDNNQTPTGSLATTDSETNNTSVQSATTTPDNNSEGSIHILTDNNSMQPLPPESQYANIGISIAKDFVYIRKDPSTDGKILGKLYHNSAATILKKEGDWYYVESGSVLGYVKAEFLKTGLSDEELIENYSTLSINVAVDGLNVREDKSQDAKRLTVVYQNEIYPVIRMDGDWMLIEIEDEHLQGYVVQEYSELIVKFKEAVSIEEEQRVLQLQAEAKAKEETAVKKNEGVNYASSDLKLLASLVHAEAGTQSYEGKLAVANVVLNRMKSSKYPDTLKAVIYQSGQFTVAASGSLDKQLNNYSSYSSTSQLMSIKAAKNALEGSNNIGSRLSFNSYKTALKKGYHEFDSSVKIGDHLFW